MRRTLLLFLFVILLAVSCFCVNRLYQIHQKESELNLSQISLLSPEMIDILSLEFTDLFTNYVMLDVLTYMGEKVIREEETTADEWHKIYKALKLIIDLDPRATDPFILATTTLPWEAGLVKETNELLEKVAQVRTNDPRPYFFLWYNSFNFLGNVEKAGEYLEKAAAVPGAPPYYSYLATRMHHYAGKTEASLLYIDSLLDETVDETRREYLLTRRDALARIAFLEKSIQSYKYRFNSYPESLHDLVTKKVIKSIPTDPYGGTFYIVKNGRVSTTSELVKVKKQKNSEQPAQNPK